jgi:hypothetical protein
VSPNRKPNGLDMSNFFDTFGKCLRLYIKVPKQNSQSLEGSKKKFADGDCVDNLTATKNEAATKINKINMLIFLLKTFNQKKHSKANDM